MSTDPVVEQRRADPPHDPHHEPPRDPGRRRRLGPLDDRWPDRFAAFAFAAAALVVVISLVRPWHRYFARNNDVVSALTIPVVPSLVYAALLVVVGVAMRRRLRAGFGLFVVWWLLVPEVARVVSLLSGGSWVQAVGLVLVAGVLVLAWRVRSQFVARHVPGSLRAAVAVAVGAGAVVLGAGIALVHLVGTSPSLGESATFTVTEMVSDLGRVGDETTVVVPFWVRLVVGLLGAAVVLTAAHLLFRASPVTRTLGAPDEARVRTLPAGLRRARLAGLLRHPPRQVGGLGRRGPRPGPGRGLLPRHRLGQPRQRQPGRRPGPVGRGRGPVAGARPRQRALPGG